MFPWKRNPEMVNGNSRCKKKVRKLLRLPSIAAPVAPSFRMHSISSIQKDLTEQPKLTDIESHIHPSTSSTIFLSSLTQSHVLYIPWVNPLITCMYQTVKREREKREREDCNIEHQESNQNQQLAASNFHDLHNSMKDERMNRSKKSSKRQEGERRKISIFYCMRMTRRRRRRRSAWVRGREQTKLMLSSDSPIFITLIWFELRWGRDDDVASRDHHDRVRKKRRKCARETITNQKSTSDRFPGISSGYSIFTIFFSFKSSHDPPPYAFVI